MTALAVIDDAVLTLDPVPALLASRCVACRQVDFPRRATCSRCRAEGAADLVLPSQGTVWTWTSQSFPPTSPPYAVRGDFEPFAVGYIDLDGCCVETRFDLPPGRWPVIGETVELVLLEVDLGGAAPVLTYAFRPVAVSR